MFFFFFMTPIIMQLFEEIWNVFQKASTFAFSSTVISPWRFDTIQPSDIILDTCYYCYFPAVSLTPCHNICWVHQIFITAIDSVTLLPRGDPTFICTIKLSHLVTKFVGSIKQSHLITRFIGSKNIYFCCWLPKAKSLPQVGTEQFLYYIQNINQPCLRIVKKKNQLRFFGTQKLHEIWNIVLNKIA